ncbi:GntR family transcriptional regulator/MocR family aminotransferase [Sphingobacterium yanglingense]|uniref:GntR family transcriptional regulator/MocR family aminotransferase n=2 Tax=Sphingobacterium yanglingense TaxID=1437280 RepID=A0A4R6WGF1_9SPHI|nr:GntR family transcriptional regulator/MocR family aminotransferase [Sphingobacterium yanglingense]
MDSSIDDHIFTEIKLSAEMHRAIYLQLADEILLLIKKGIIRSNQKLPSSRKIAHLLNLNRITVTKAISELQTQGWLESFVGRGTFVSNHIPDLEPEQLRNGTNATKAQNIAGFELNELHYLVNPYFVPVAELHLDDGYPDPRLAPIKELYRAYRNQLSRGGIYNRFGSYNSPDGPDDYKEALSQYLNESRGLKTKAENILSVRGTLMGINLVCNALISPGDVIVSGIPGWQRAEHNFIHARARHIGISVDEYGIVVDELREICKKTPVRMVYVTPHHHYPTTVSLRIDRRLELLRLASEYGFIIFEDDYDFDFHYNNRPLMPLASADENGMVIYCGSFSKSFSPAFRMGYLVASENVIAHLANIRILLDRQGDHILDNAMAQILNDGTIQRYLRKASKIYEERRDYFCSLLTQNLTNAVEFAIPDGGMTIWARFDEKIDLEKLAKIAYKKGLYFSDGSIHKYANFNKNATRLGFASATKEDLQSSVAILKSLIA